MCGEIETKRIAPLDLPLVPDPLAASRRVIGFGVNLILR
jgi:hypothetical protein